MDIIQNIQAVINTLEKVSVSGSENWERMLACRQHLQKIQKEMMTNADTDTSIQQRDPENTADSV